MKNQKSIIKNIERVMNMPWLMLFLISTIIYGTALMMCFMFLANGNKLIVNMILSCYGVGLLLSGISTNLIYVAKNSKWFWKTLSEFEEKVDMCKSERELICLREEIDLFKRMYASHEIMHNSCSGLIDRIADKIINEFHVKEEIFTISEVERMLEKLHFTSEEELRSKYSSTSTMIDWKKFISNNSHEN